MNRTGHRQRVLARIERLRHAGAHIQAAIAELDSISAEAEISDEDPTFELGTEVRLRLVPLRERLDQERGRLAEVHVVQSAEDLASRNSRGVEPADDETVGT